MKLPNPVREIRSINALLAGADAAARGMGDASPGPEHLLIATLSMEDGTARRAFDRLGADPDAFAPAVPPQHDAALRDRRRAGVDRPRRRRCGTGTRRVRRHLRGTAGVPGGGGALQAGEAVATARGARGDRRRRRGAGHGGADPPGDGRRRRRARRGGPRRGRRRLAVRRRGPLESVAVVAARESPAGRRCSCRVWGRSRARRPPSRRT